MKYFRLILVLLIVALLAALASGKGSSGSWSSKSSGWGSKTSGGTISGKSNSWGGKSSGWSNSRPTSTPSKSKVDTKTLQSQKIQTHFEKEPTTRPSYIPQKTSQGHTIIFNQGYGCYGYYGTGGIWFNYPIYAEAPLVRPWGIWDYSLCGLMVVLGVIVIVVVIYKGTR